MVRNITVPIDGVNVNYSEFGEVTYNFLPTMDQDNILDWEERNRIAISVFIETAKKTMKTMTEQAIYDGNGTIIKS